MPWEVKFKGGDPKPYKVVKKGSGEVVASHESREKAQQQVKALYANTDEEPRKQEKPQEKPRGRY